MSHAIRLHDGLGQIAVDPAAGILLAYGTTVPAANSVGYAPGCRFIKVDGVTADTVEYINLGTRAASSFAQAGLSGQILVNYIYGDALAIDAGFFVATRSYQIQAISMRPLVAGTDASAVTAVVRKSGSGTAISGGSATHTGTLNLKGTINTVQTVTINSNPANSLVTNGQTLGLNITGTATAARGVVSVLLLPQ